MLKGLEIETRFQYLVLQPASLHQPIMLIRKNRRSSKVFSLLWRHIRIRNNDDNVSHLHTPRCRAIQANDAASALAPDGVSLETLAIVVVHDLHFLAFHDVGCFEQVLINGDAADVVQVGLRNADTVYFAFENFDEHGFLFLASENNQSPYSVAKVEALGKARVESLRWQFFETAGRSGVSIFKLFNFTDLQ